MKPRDPLHAQPPAFLPVLLPELPAPSAESYIDIEYCFLVSVRLTERHAGTKRLTVSQHFAVICQQAESIMSKVGVLRNMYKTMPLSPSLDDHNACPWRCCLEWPHPPPPPEC